MLLTVVSTPSPPVKVRVSVVRVTVSFEPESAAIVRLLATVAKLTAPEPLVTIAGQ